jgi:hypothetical protein
MGEEKNGKRKNKDHRQLIMAKYYDAIRNNAG